jgi:hypothetical protein
MMQFVPDANLITPEQRWQAGCKFLEGDRQFVSEMRAYHWTLENATLEQVLAAIEAAEDLIAADDSVLPDGLAKHNTYRDAFGLPPLSLGEFRGLVMQLAIYQELLGLLATGTIQ